MRSLSLAGEELSRLLGNRLLRVALVVVALVPLLYGALYLWAFWDPNGHIDRIPVAVVNEDRPALVDGKRVAAGDDLVEELRDRGTMEWHLVDSEEARRGLHDGTYYLALRIPDDFSAALASASGEHPHRAKLVLTKQESSNMLASQIGDRVFAEVRAAASASGAERYFDQMLVGFGDVHDSIGKAADGADALADGLESAGAGADALADGAGTAHAGASKLADGASDLAAGTLSARDGAGKLAQGAAALSAGLSAADAGSARLAGGARDAATGAAELAGGADKVGSAATQLAEATAQLSAGAESVDAGMALAAPKLAAAVDGSARVAAGSKATVSALEAFAAAHPELSNDPQFAQALGAARQTSGGAGELAAGLSESSAGIGALQIGAHRVATGSGAVAQGAGALAAGARQVAVGSARLSDGTAALADGSASLAQGVARANSGAAALSDGSARLSSGTTELSAGAGRLSDGASDLAAGLSALKSGSRELAVGISPAVSGSRELANQLTAGVDDIPHPSDGERAAKTGMMSDPVDLAKVRLGTVPNYGTGFAPYFVPLSLWVGAMVIFFIVPPVTEKALSDRVPSGIAALSGYWPAAVLGVAQALALIAVLRFGLGLEPQSTPALFAFAILVSFVFVAILQWLSATFGLAGKFFAIVLLMLQLTSSAGTYPIETLPTFFRAIGPLLPMTYVVAGLRQIVSGGNWWMAARDALAVGAFGMGALVLSAISVRLRRAGKLALATAEF